MALLKDLGVGHALQRAPAGNAVRIVVDVASEAVARPWSSHTREPATRAHSAALGLDGHLSARWTRSLAIGIARVGLHSWDRWRRGRRGNNTGDSDVTGERADLTRCEPEGVGTRHQVKRVRVATAVVSCAMLCLPWAVPYRRMGCRVARTEEEGVGGAPPGNL